jgi:hypothetical protein
MSTCSIADLTGALAEQEQSDEAFHVCSCTDGRTPLSNEPDSLTSVFFARQSLASNAEFLLADLPRDALAIVQFSKNMAFVIARVEYGKRLRERLSRLNIPCSPPPNREGSQAWLEAWNVDYEDEDEDLD